MQSSGTTLSPSGYAPDRCLFLWQSSKLFSNPFSVSSWRHQFFLKLHLPGVLYAQLLAPRILHVWSISDYCRNHSWISYCKGIFAERLHHLDNVYNLETTLPVVIQCLLTGNIYKRSTYMLCLGNASDQVSSSWSQSWKTNPWFYCQPSVSCGHKSCSLFMPCHY